MASNIYHILHKLPALDDYEMPEDLEKIALGLVKSGLLRIDGGHKMNFTRFSMPYRDIHHIFSYRELTDPILLPRTRSILANYLKLEHGTIKLYQRINYQIQQMLKDMKKYQPIDEITEMAIARLLVQASHPAVLMLIIIEKVEIFISYSWNIGDMLDIQSWQISGDNSGMQQTDGVVSAIFVSCGGDPFSLPHEPNLPYGDGFPAIARLMVIAGQEIGHFADIKRDNWGRQYTRYSANFSATRPTKEAREARISDMKNLSKINELLQQSGFERAFEAEKYVLFFRKIKRKGMFVWYSKIKMRILSTIFLYNCRQKKLYFVEEFSSGSFPATKISKALEDMRFNLAPIADVYRRSNPIAEEAIACIEALARVPQQVVKWGDNMTKFMIPNLYSLYYDTVIPGCIEAYEILSGRQYNVSKLTPKVPLWRRIYKLFRKSKLLRPIDW